MDTALKHRLTGAVILVLLAVLLLPELLSGRGQSERVGASGTGAAAGGAERSIEIDLTEAARAPLAPPADATPAAESAAPPTADAPVVLPVPPAASAPAASTPAVSAPAANTPAVNTPPPAPAPGSGKNVQFGHEVAHAVQGALPGSTAGSVLACLLPGVGKFTHDLDRHAHEVWLWCGG